MRLRQDWAVDFRVADPAEPPASELLAAMVDEVSAAYGTRIDQPGAPTATAEELSPPVGVCLVGYLDGRPVCVGAVKRLEDGLAEIKRMYVVPEARGRGVARALLAALERSARMLGYSRVRLDTGPKQAPAEAMYRSAGYREIGNYNANPFATFFGEKSLEP